MDLQYGHPFKGRKLDDLKAFLHSMGLDYDERIDFTVIGTDDDGAIIACASLDQNICKCIAVSDDHQGEGITATLITELRKEAFARNADHLFLFTKPMNRAQFTDMAFFPIVQTKDVLLMASKRNGARDYARSLKEDLPEGSKIAGIVMNANPFTKGHRYLVETAAKACDLVHVFVVSEDKGYFSFAERGKRVTEGVAELPNVRVHETKQYMISSVTFPTYFIKDKARIEDVRCRLDLAVFADIFAREMGITVRYVGTEPNDKVTALYNEIMKEYLPGKGIEVREIPRLTDENGEVISASRIRKHLQEAAEVCE